MPVTDLAAALSKAARAIDAARDLDETLIAITESAVISLPGIQHAGISLIRGKDRSIETKAATSDLPRQLDDLQFEFKEGPCYDAMVDGSPDVQVSDDIRHDQRWPKYVPRAVELGLKAQMGVRLFNRDGLHGALNLYSTQDVRIPQETVEVASLFAVNAAVVLGRAHREENLQTAITTRTTIGVAMGLMMARYQISQEQAFQFLTRISQDTNTKLREVAERVIDDATDEHG